MKLGIFETTELARAVAANFDGVMMDEYQDTSPLQDVCFAAVGRDDMFVVGDLKQSIYSSRRKTRGLCKKTRCVPPHRLKQELPQPQRRSRFCELCVLDDFLGRSRRR